jgi:tetratricopeptide (TPR) repeat protein
MSAPLRESAGDAIVVSSRAPRLNIMISSTSLDLPEHRRQVMDAILRMGHSPLAMEHGTAKTDDDAISMSLDMVDQADLYLGIFAQRYGHKPKDKERNPKRLSVTELEYRRAAARKMPILRFVAHAEHQFTEAQFEGDRDSRKKLDALKKELTHGKICGFFKSPEDLRALVVQALSQVQVELRPTAADVGPPEPRGLPAPPNVYAVPEYKLTNTFIGRSSELELLDEWSKSSDAILVVNGIGGLGKSAVTWEWMKNRAPAAIPNLAGRVWWSFYERGTSMVTFVRHALAYVTARDPEGLIKDWSHYQRGQELLAELRRRPFLLVLDGFERVLTAYHRLDKAQIPDEQVDTDLRDCINAPDGELLTQLLDCGPSKILISTRLFPSALENRGSHKPIAGVARHELNGLSPRDALALMRQCGVEGDELAMLDFAGQFGRHSLLLLIVCGMIADYRRKPHDFDAWRADPVYGGGLKLTELDLKQRYTHILHFALRGLDEQTRKLLCRIAVISENANDDTIAVLNPFLPARPAEVEEPSDPSESWSWRHLSGEEKEKAQTRFREAQDAFRRYQEALRAYFASAGYRRSVAAFDAALEDLENRGLLQWDRESNRYDMHPVVRGYAAELLEQGDRTETFLKVRDHFAGLPPDDLDKATELAHVTHSLEIYRCLVGAGMLEEAARHYRGKLGHTLMWYIGAYSVILELLRPLFGGDLHGMPGLDSRDGRGFFLNELGNTYSGLGREDKAVGVYGTALQLGLDDGDWPGTATTLRNHGNSLYGMGRQSEAEAAVHLARELSEAADDADGVTGAILFQIADAVKQGRLADAAALAAEFQQRTQPHVVVYRPGHAEYWRCKSQFYQGKLTEAEWQAGYDVTLQHRNVFGQHGFLALRAEWDLRENRPETALKAVEQALQITKKLGMPRPHLHDLRAWALACVGRIADARAELAAGQQRLFAAEAYLVLGDRERARECALNAYRKAWGEGPPYCYWYYLERSKALLQQLGEPEPQLPPFGASKVPPIPFEKEIRAAIERLKAERAARVESTTDSD